MSLLHGGCHQPLEQLLYSHIDEEKTDAPQTASHQVHPKQAGDEKIDVTGSRFGYRLVACGHRVLPSRGLLQRVVDQPPGERAFGPGRVEQETDRRAGITDNRGLAQPQALQAFLGGMNFNRELRVPAQSIRQG